MFEFIFIEFNYNNDPMAYVDYVIEKIQRYLDETNQD